MNCDWAGENRNTLISSLRKISEASSSSFSELALLADLDPAKDFQNADLRGADLRGEDLTEFNFSGSDLTGANIEGTVFNEHSKRSMILDNNLSPSRTFEPHEWLTESENFHFNRPPIDVIETIENIRRADWQTKDELLRQLLRKCVGYTENRLEQIANLKFSVPFMKTTYQRPYWLQEFLIEAKALYWPEGGSSLVNRAFRAIFGREISDKEFLIKRASFHQFDQIKVESIERLVKDFGEDEEVQDLISELAFSNEENQIRTAALESLIINNRNREQLKQKLICTFVQMQDTMLRGIVLKKLGELCESDDDVMRLILSIVNDPKDNWARRQALLILGSYYGTDDATDAAVIKIVFGSIVNGTAGVKQIAFKIFGAILKDKEHGREIIEALYDSQSSSAGKLFAFDAMYTNFKGSAKIIEIAKRVGKREEDEGLFFLSELVRFSINDEALFEHLRDRLLDDVFDEGIEDFIRRKIVMAVGTRMQIDDRLAEWLIRVVEVSRGSLTRAEAMNVMIKNLDNFSRFVDILRKAFKKNPNDFLYYKSARLLVEQRGWKKPD